MIRNDDDDDDDSGPTYGQIFSSLYCRMTFGNEPTPMTNAGRYLSELASADSSFKSAGESITEEMTAALRRIQIVSGRTA